MFLTKIESNLIFSKKNILDLVLVNYLLKLNYTNFSASSNHFISLKSPFHYKLGKNHLSIESIRVGYYVLSQESFESGISVLGSVASSSTLKKKKYNL